MSKPRFTEVLPVKLPEGTRAKLAEIAESRYKVKLCCRAEGNHASD